MEADRKNGRRLQQHRWRYLLTIPTPGLLVIAAYGQYRLRSVPRSMQRISTVSLPIHDTQHCLILSILRQITTNLVERIITVSLHNTILVHISVRAG